MIGKVRVSKTYSDNKRKSNLHFNEDGTERQDSAHQNDDRRFHKPFLLWYGTWHSIDAARIIGLAAQVSSQNRTHQRERQNDEEANACDSQLKSTMFVNESLCCNLRTHHNRERNGPGRVIVDSDEVDHESRSADDRGQKEGAQQHLFDPTLS